MTWPAPNLKSGKVAAFKQNSKIIANKHWKVSIFCEAYQRFTPSIVRQQYKTQRSSTGFCCICRNDKQCEKASQLHSHMWQIHNTKVGHRQCRINHGAIGARAPAVSIQRAHRTPKKTHFLKSHSTNAGIVFLPTKNSDSLHMYALIQKCTLWLVKFSSEPSKMGAQLPAQG